MFNRTLEKIHIFGAKFGFKIKNDETYKTAFGGTLTVFTLTVIIIFSVFMGQDFYYRINPSVYLNTIVPEKYDPPMSLRPENFKVAWRIEGDDKFALNFSKVLYPVMKRFRFKRNSKDQLDLIEDVALQLTKCTEENAKVPEFAKNFKLDDWYCFDWTKSNFTFGFFWDGDYVDAFQTLVFLCENGVEYDIRILTAVNSRITVISVIFTADSKLVLCTRSTISLRMTSKILCGLRLRITSTILI